MFNACSTTTASPLGFPSGEGVGALGVGGGAQGVCGGALGMCGGAHVTLGGAEVILGGARVPLGLVPLAQIVLSNPCLPLLPRFFKLWKFCMSSDRDVQSPGSLGGGLARPPPSLVKVENTKSTSLNSMTFTSLYKRKKLK